MGKDDYPRDMTAAYSMLVNYRTPSDLARLGNSNSNPDAAPSVAECRSQRDDLCA
jgi:hypothetical protein